MAIKRDLTETDMQALRTLRHIAPWGIGLIVMPLLIWVFRMMWANNLLALIVASIMLAVVGAALTWLVYKRTHARSSLLARWIAPGFTAAAMGFLTIATAFGMGDIPQGLMFVIWLIGTAGGSMAWNIYHAKRDAAQIAFDVPPTKVDVAGIRAAVMQSLPAGTAPTIEATVISDTTTQTPLDPVTAEVLAKVNAEKAVMEARAAAEAADANARRVLGGWKDLIGRDANGKANGVMKILADCAIRVTRNEDYCTELNLTLSDGIEPEHVMQFKGKLAGKFRVGVPAVRVVGNPDDNSDVTVRVVWFNPLKDTIHWPGPQDAGIWWGSKPIVFGRREDNTPARLLLPSNKKYGKANSSHVLIEGVNGSGKALALDTPVPTPTGWTTMGEIKAGDVVFDEHGRPTTVTHAWDVRYDRPCYEVTFSDGSTIVADADHQWLVDDYRSRIADSHQRQYAKQRNGAPATNVGYARYTWPQVLTTGEMAESVRVKDGRLVNYSVRVAGALDCPDADLPIPAYVLGSWLGDGTSADGSITCADPEIIAEIEAEGETTHVYPSTKTDRTPQYRVHGLLQRLRALGLLKNKHIPVAYLRASEAQRRDLLAGLLDTDGSCTKSGRVEFYSTRERLAREVLHLVASLGYKATLRCKTAWLNGKDCGLTWTVSFTPGDKVFRLPRKLARQVTEVGATARHRYITDIRPVESVPVRCIAVDSPSHLFLVGETCIATHNSETMLCTVGEGVTQKGVCFWGIDVGKVLQTFGPIMPAMDWMVTERIAAKMMLKAIIEAGLPSRGALFGRLGVKEWSPEVAQKYGIPYIVLFIEEGGIIFETLARDLTKTLMLARSLGFCIWGSLQRAQHENLDPNARSQFTEVLTFGMERDEDIFGMPDWLQDMGADPTQWGNTLPGMHYHKTPLVPRADTITPQRSMLTDPAMLRRVTEQYGPNMMRPEQSLIDAINGFSFKPKGEEEAYTDLYDERETGMDVERRLKGDGEVPEIEQAPQEAQAVQAAVPQPRERIDLDRRHPYPAAEDEVPGYDFLDEDPEEEQEEEQVVAAQARATVEADDDADVVFGTGDDDEEDNEEMDEILDDLAEELADDDDILDALAAIEDEDDGDTEDIEGHASDEHAATARPTGWVLEFDGPDWDPQPSHKDKSAARRNLLRVLAAETPGYVFRSADLYDNPEIGYLNRSQSWIRGEVIALATQGVYVEEIDDPGSKYDGWYRTTEEIRNVPRPPVGELVA